jgi:GNAT superfamily N-acetyltransferase
MRALLRRLLRRRETYLLFSAHLADAQTGRPAGPANIEATLISNPGDRLAEPLEQFCAAVGFPPGWAGDMFSDGARSVVALDTASGQVAAMGWLVRRAFYVAEVDHTIDPAGGVYFFGDFVAPAYRGRRLQRLVLQHRIARCAQDGITHAYTIIGDDNGPSIANYRALGFVSTTAMTCTRWLGRTKYGTKALPTLTKGLRALVPDPNSATRLLRPA